eukprot:10800854-Alexandrium_andersonii.AAC.1
MSSGQFDYDREEVEEAVRVERNSIGTSYRFQRRDPHPVLFVTDLSGDRHSEVHARPELQNWTSVTLLA